MLSRLRCKAVVMRLRLLFLAADATQTSTAEIRSVMERKFLAETCKSAFRASLSAASPKPLVRRSRGPRICWIHGNLMLGNKDDRAETRPPASPSPSANVAHTCALCKPCFIPWTRVGCVGKLRNISFRRYYMRAGRISRAGTILFFRYSLA